MEAEEDTVEKKSEVKFGRRLKKTEDVRASGVRRVHSEDRAEGINGEDRCYFFTVGDQKSPIW